MVCNDLQQANGCGRDSSLFFVHCLFVILGVIQAF